MYWRHLPRGLYIYATACLVLAMHWLCPLNLCQKWDHPAVSWAFVGSGHLFIVGFMHGLPLKRGGIMFSLSLPVFIVLELYGTRDLLGFYSDWYLFVVQSPLQHYSQWKLHWKCFVPRVKCRLNLHPGNWLAHVSKLESQLTHGLTFFSSIFCYSPLWKHSITTHTKVLCCSYFTCIHTLNCREETKVNGWCVAFGKESG